MPNRYDVRLRGDDAPPAWRPPARGGLAGVIDRYILSETPHGLVRTVIVTEDLTGEQLGLRLAPTHVLALFAA